VRALGWARLGCGSARACFVYKNKNDVMKLFVSIKKMFGKDENN